jgi:hypothetical protein
VITIAPADDLTIARELRGCEEMSGMGGFVIQSRRSRESRSDGRRRTAKELKIRGSGWNPFAVTRLRLELRILRSFGALRRRRLRLRAFASLRMTA